MTKEECIERLTDIMYGYTVENDVIKFAIKTLEQRPSEDCVSREETLKVFAEKCGGECACCEYNGSGYDNAENCKLIKSLPSVTPTRKSGLHWIERFDNEDKWLECPHCHKDSDNAYAYCPNCGAEMI